MIHIPHREDNSFSIVYLISLVVPLLFVPIFPEAYETVKYPLFLLLTGIGILILLVRKEIFISKSALYGLGALVLLYILSTIFSLDFSNSLIGIYGRYTGSLTFIVAWALFIILVWNALKGDEQRRISLLRVLFFDALAISIFGIFQYFDFVYYGGNVDSARLIIPSFVGNQNFYAMFLVAVLPAAMTLWQHVQSKWAKYYFVVAGIIISWAIVLSGSRGGILGLGVGIAVLLFIAFLRRYSRHYWIGAAAIAVVTAIFYAGFFATTRTDTSNGVSDTAQYTTQARYVIWSDTAKLIKQSPWLGTGPGNFFISFQGLGNTALTGNERFDDAHNLALNLAATVGLPALIVFLVLIVLAVLKSWREVSFQKSTAIWVLSALAGLLAAAMFNPISIPIWMLLGLILAFAHSYTTVIRPFNFKVKVAGLILAVLLILFAIGFITGEVLSGYGIAAYHKHEDVKAQSFLQKAVYANPFNSTSRFFLIGAQINLQKNYEKAYQDIEDILSAHPNSSQIFKTAADLNYRLFILSKDEKYKQRMTELYDRSIQLEPNSSQLYGSAAYAFYKTGQSDRSLEYLERQLNLPDTIDYPYSWILRGKIYLERNQKEEALQAMEQALAGLPDQPLIKYFVFKIKQSDSVDELPFPVVLPDIDI